MSLSGIVVLLSYFAIQVTTTWAASSITEAQAARLSALGGLAGGGAALSAVVVAIVSVQISSRGVRASELATEITQEAESRNQRPVLKLDTIAAVGDVDVICHNIGIGPAMNIQCWLVYEEFQHLQSTNNRRTLPGIGAGGQEKVHWYGSRDGKLPDKTSGYSVIAQYEDLNGRLAQTILELASQGIPMLDYKAPGEVAEDLRRFS